MTDTILVIDDDVTLNQLLVRQLKTMGYAAEGVGRWAEARSYLGNHEPNLILLDCRLPDAEGQNLLNDLVYDYPVVVLTAYGSVKEAVHAMQAGVSDYLVKPVDLDELELVVKRSLETAAIRQDYQFCKSQLHRPGKTFMVGTSEALQKVNQLIDAVAPSDMTVLIQGESGVGKELVAQEIHQRSTRADRNFVTLDCCTLQESLFESELFGHERGAFTSADRQKKGLIESAAGGTLFLDQLGELSLSVQAKLLRFLETGHFRRVGGTKDLDVDGRIIAATNRDLESMSLSGGFRLDLFYRLNAFSIPVAPLRERREDIPALAAHFIRNHDFSRRVNKIINAAAMQRLMAYDWPGNVRELKNIVERAIILSGNTPKIRPEHLAFSTNGSQLYSNLTMTFNREPTLSEIEQRYLKMMLDKYSGHRAKVADILGISERNVYRMIKKHRLVS